MNLYLIQSEGDDPRYVEAKSMADAIEVYSEHIQKHGAYGSKDDPREGIESVALIERGNPFEKERPPVIRRDST